MSPLSPRGAGIRGDDYQHLFAWCCVLRALQVGCGINSIGIEDPEGESFDDVTVYQSKERNEFYQVKSSADSKSLACFEWLRKRSPSGGPSLFQRFFSSWHELRTNGRSPRLCLVTNRLIDPRCSVMGLRDARDGTLARKLADTDAPKDVVLARQELAEHLDTSDDELLLFLEDLEFRLGKSGVEWEGQARFLMNALGMKSDSKAIMLGVSTVRKWVTDGKRRLLVPDIQNEIDSLGLQISRPSATLLVQALEYDAMPENATVVIDWVQHYSGMEPRTRRALIDNTLWNSALRPELKKAVEEIKAKGHNHVLVKGAARLPTWFAIGTELGKTAGFEVAAAQGLQVWRSDIRAESYEVRSRENVFCEGSGIAVAINLATDISDDVCDFVNSELTDVSRVIEVYPSRGSGNQAIGDAPEALGWAYATRDLLRRISGKLHPSTLHVFLATPHAAALLLGHLWDRMPRTQLYDDLGRFGKYSPSFLIPN